MTGWLALAMSPSVAESNGTSRQPSTSCPSARTASSSFLSQAARLGASAGRKTMPAA